jgi:hypothetical protein
VEEDAASEPVSLEQLLPEHAAELAAALPEGMLPADWQSTCATWEQLERAMRWAVKGFTRTQVWPVGAVTGSCCAVSGARVLSSRQSGAARWWPMHHPALLSV